MIHFEIESTELKTSTGISKRTGQPYTMHKQKALMFRDGERFPDKVMIPVADGQSAYPLGVYSLHDSSFQVSRFGDPELRPVLVRVQQSAKSAQVA